jgi:hypothetical protein
MQKTPVSIHDTPKIRADGDGFLASGVHASERSESQERYPDHIETQVLIQYLRFILFSATPCSTRLCGLFSSK